MQGIRTELPNNTPEQVRQYVQGALDVVAELAVPDDLRVAAFTAACNLLSAKQLIVQPVGVATPGMAVPRGL